MVQHNFQQVSTLFTDNSRSNNTNSNHVDVSSYTINPNQNQVDFNKQSYLNSNLNQNQRTAQNFNYYDPNTFQYPSYTQNASIVPQNAQTSNLPSYTNLTNVANTLAKSTQFLRNFPNVYENLNNNYSTSAKNVKAGKSNSDGENSKIYGNAFLGQNLWDKNDLFQSEKFGVKFECLEIDEFLNENGLNETDVEFLDQLHKYENINPTTTSTNNTGNNSINNQTTQSPKSSLISTPSTSPSSKSLDSNLMNSNLNMLHSASSSASSISGSSSPSSTQNNRGNLNQNIQFSTGSMSKNKQDSMDTEKACSRSSYDWNLSINESSMDSLSDYDDYDPKMKKYNDDDLKPQSVSRKSKKQFVPNELKDEKYWARRRKNNLAAKRSRDARRMKENQIAVRASYLERENDLLRKQLEDFKRETKLLKTKLARYESDVQIENPIK